MNLHIPHLCVGIEKVLLIFEKLCFEKMGNLNRSCKVNVFWENTLKTEHDGASRVQQDFSAEKYL